MLLALVALSACARRTPVPVAGAEGASEEERLASLSIPLDVREFEVAHADGHRGVFLKLSRLPDAVEHHSESNPARIVVGIKGPTGGEAAEQVFPGNDSLVFRLRITRTFGVLTVVLDLEGDRPPRYSVHPMGDWIMIRLASDESSRVGTPPGGALAAVADGR